MKAAPYFTMYQDRAIILHKVSAYAEPLVVPPAERLYVVIATIAQLLRFH